MKRFQLLGMEPTGEGTMAAKYLEVAEVIRRRSQRLPEGSRLPSERILAAEFDISVGTARQALALLASEGWVKRNRASGTFAARPSVSMGPSLSSFTEDMTRRGLTPSSEVLHSELVTPDLETIVSLGLRPKEQAFYLERLRRADGEPMCLERSLFPGRLGPLLQAADLTGSVHAALAAHAIVPRTTQRCVRAVVVPLRDAHLLGLPQGAPALEIFDSFVDTLGRPMQSVTSRYRFDRYEVLTVAEAGMAPIATASAGHI